MSDFLIDTIVTIILCLFVYLILFIFANVSYELFYADMVEDTIREMVDMEYLKK